jgi:hypothetical protein
MEEFAKATTGLHAMWNEHFGIGKFFAFINNNSLY